MSVKSFFFSIVLAFASTTAFSAYAESGKALTKEDIEKIVRSYILENPEIIEEAILKRRQQIIAEQKKKQANAIASLSDKLYRSKYDYVAGNPKGDVTVVEFFDYNCGFCRKAFKDVSEVIKKDKNVRVVFKELPIFGEPSVQSAKAALASIKQGKYFEFHRDMLLKPGRATLEKAMSVAKDLGMDLDKLKKDMESEDVAAALKANNDLANSIGLRGTPLYVVNNQIINGAPQDLEKQILERVSIARKQAKN